MVKYSKGHRHKEKKMSRVLIIEEIDDPKFTVRSKEELRFLYDLLDLYHNVEIKYFEEKIDELRKGIESPGTYLFSPEDVERMGVEKIRQVLNEMLEKKLEEQKEACRKYEERKAKLKVAGEELDKKTEREEKEREERWAKIDLNKVIDKLCEMRKKEKGGK